MIAALGTAPLRPDEQPPQGRGGGWSGLVQDGPFGDGWYSGRMAARVSTMDVARPAAALGPTLDVTVLVVLARTSRPLTGREVARLAGRHSHSGVADALHRLTEHGLINRQDAGRAALFTLNRDHVAAPVVEAIANLRNELFRRLREAIEGWAAAPLHASVFGSTARGDGNTASDIDIFVVRPRMVSYDDDRWRQQLDDLSDQVMGWTGNRASIAEVGEVEIDRLRRQDPPIISELRTDAITLVGPQPLALLGATG